MSPVATKEPQVKRIENPWGRFDVLQVSKSNLDRIWETGLWEDAQKYGELVKDDAWPIEPGSDHPATADTEANPGWAMKYAPLGFVWIRRGYDRTDRHRCFLFIDSLEVRTR